MSKKKSWLFKKINKTNKSLAKLTEGTRGMSKLVKLR